jgi:hypothetical protein
LAALFRIIVPILRDGARRSVGWAFPGNWTARTLQRDAVRVRTV